MFFFLNMTSDCHGVVVGVRQAEVLFVEKRKRKNLVDARGQRRKARLLALSTQVGFTIL